MTKEATQQPISMMPYALKFAGFTVLLSLLVVFITELLKFDVPSSMGIITLIAAAVPVAQSFVSKNSRVMSKGERLSFATLGSIFSLLASLVLFAGFMKFSGVELSTTTLNEIFGTPEIPWGILAAILAFALVISWLVLYFSMGWMCKGAMKRLGLDITTRNV
jgi:hypothetical protein